MRTLEEIVKEVIRDRLLRLDDNKNATAKSLGISAKTLRNNLERYGIKTAKELEKKAPEYVKKVTQPKTKKARPAIETYSWEDDPNFDTGYLEPTPEERDDWNSRDYF